MRLPYVCALLCLLAATATTANTVVLAQDASSPPTGHIDNIASFARFLRAADGVYVADVVRVGPSPGFWSGYIKAFQTVHYRLTETVVEHPHWDVPQELDIQFLIVQPSPWVQKDTPALRPDVFEEGARHLVLFLSLDYFADGDEHHALVNDSTSAVVFKWMAPSE